MKPRFKKIGGLWYCGMTTSRDGHLFYGQYLGFGWTISGAWDDWKAQR